VVGPDGVDDAVGQGLAHQLRPVGPASLPLRHEPGRAEGHTTLHVETLLELQRNPDEGPPLDAAGLHRSLPAVSDGQVDGTAQLAGNSVGTDKAFLARDMPELIDHLHYRIVDVSSLKELAKRWYPRTFFQAPKKAGGHRALADILESIDELRYYRAVLFPSGEGPSSQECKEAAERVMAEPTR